MEIQVVINPDGKTCTSLNPLGLKFKEYKKCGALHDSCGYGDNFCECKRRINWQQAESERRTYEFLGCWKNCNCSEPCFKPNSTHTAQIINGKAIIK